jgi:hypothetical protein
MLRRDSLSLRPRNTFVTGFLTALVLWVGWWLYTNAQIQGVHVEDSPSGRYTLMVMAPMNPTSRGTYVVTLTEKASGRILRTNSIRLDSGQKTKSIRGLPVSMDWNATESAADVTIDGEFLIRISVPTSGVSGETRTNNAMHPSRGSAAS